MIKHFCFWLSVLFALAVAGGCASRKVQLQLEGEQPFVLDSTPFYQQKEYQCGPAALAMVLSASGIEVHPDDLTPLTYLPERKGSLQLELLAACRLHDRIPYVINPDLNSLRAELKGGRPVLVLQNLGVTILPAYHYAVVIGMSPPDKIVLHSGDKKQLPVSIERFLATWKRAGAWAMVALRPGEIPAIPDRARFLEAISAFELSGARSQAAKSYQAAHTRWPEDQTTLLALANNYLAQQKYEEAEQIYKDIINNDPENIAAANNLAETFLQRGCYAEALRVIDQLVFSLEEIPPPFGRAVEQTRSEIRFYLDSASITSATSCEAL